jgi:RNA polymerase sigma-70 factor (ECF subfamily)
VTVTVTVVPLTPWALVSLGAVGGNEISVATELEQLYREHRAGLVRLVERELHDRHEAEDVVQTAFLEAQRALERGTTPRNPPAWLAAIALNAGRRLRRRHQNAEPLEDYAVQEASAIPEIRVALAGLPREQRTAVVYRDILGLSYDETAKQMDLSVNAVTMLLHRGRRRLRQTLGITAGGIGLWRWLKRAWMPQFAVTKGAAAVVGTACLATTGIVAARVIAPVASGMPPAAGTTPSGTRAEEAGRARGRALSVDATRRGFSTIGGSSIGAHPSEAAAAGTTEESADAAPTVGTPEATSRSVSSLLPTTLPLPALSISTVAATVTVSTPVATVTVAPPTQTTATVTTPIVTVTLPIP